MICLNILILGSLVVRVLFWQLGSTPLMTAARMGHADVISLLMDNGARCDLADNAGRTAVSSN